MKPLPLEGIRVLDLSRVLAGPLCTMMLGDLGAQVIKVERPDTGDDTRGWGPPFAEDGDSAYFRSVNRNKVSIALDFSAPDDIAVIKNLLKDADAVVDNFLPGQLARYGIDRASMMALHSQLVWCTISGFGARSTRPGYDFVVQAESGWMAVTGEPDGVPMKTGVAFVDVITGKDAAVAILAALVGRERKSVSERQIDVSLAHSATAALVNVAQNVLVSGRDAVRWGNAHPNLVPYQLFETADRPMVIAVGADSQWRSLTSALDLVELAADATLATNAGRVHQRQRVVSAITERLASNSAEYWMNRLQAAKVPCGIVRSVHEALADSDTSAITGVAPLAGGRIRIPSPKLNEHAKLVREKQWSLFNHLPILAQTDV